MKYNRAEAKDIPQLIELRKKQLNDEGLTSTNNIDIELHNYFEVSLRDGSFISWIAVEGDTIVATSGICFYQLPPTYSNPTGRIAYVTNMYTRNEYRGKGIASDLLKLVVSEAKEQGYKFVRLHASKQGASVYKRFGFVDSDGYMIIKL
jgi:ribosomal protein S18 acetylase RimI-like enzyme